MGVSPISRYATRQTINALNALSTKTGEVTNQEQQKRKHSAEDDKVGGVKREGKSIKFRSIGNWEQMTDTKVRIRGE